MRGYGHGPYFGEDKPIRFDYGTVADDFGNVWPKCSDECRLQVVRPGKAQCDCSESSSSTAPLEK
jgi:hypothetical protein